MEKLMEPDFIGIADYIDSQEDWRNPERKILNREFFTVVVDDLLEFLWEYYLPL
jgi:hypothetical protein